MDAQAYVVSGPRQNWQQWAVWLAKSGYSEMEYSVLMTAQQLARRHERVAGRGVRVLEHGPPMREMVGR